MFKELWQLIKWLFTSKPKDVNELEIVEMTYFPFKGFSAMSWCGKLIVHSKSKISKSLLTHETIHLKQAQAVGSWIIFYLLYIKEWLMGNPFKVPFISAYYTICYEMEAYANENNSEYAGSYDDDNINKYRLMHKKETYKEQGETLRQWIEYIRTLNNKW